MELITKNIVVKGNFIQVIQLKWSKSWIFIIDAPKGTITCGSFDIDFLNKFKLPAAKVVPDPEEPAFTIEQFIRRKITHINKTGEICGLRVNMPILEAVGKLI